MSEIPQKDHIFALFDPLKMGNLMIPEHSQLIWGRQIVPFEPKTDPSFSSACTVDAYHWSSHLTCQKLK